MMDKIARMCERRPRTVILVAILVTAFMAYGLTKISVTTDFKAFLPESYPSVKTTLELENSFGGTSYEMILLKADNFTNAEIIRDVLSLENGLKSDPGLDNYAESYLSYVDYVAQYIPNFGTLPDNLLEANVEYLIDNFLTNPQTSASMTRLVTADKKAALIYVYVNTKLSTSELSNKTKILGRNVDNFDKTHTELAASVGGSYTSNNDIMAIMNRDNSVLIPAAVILVAIILLLTFRRLSDILLCFMVIGLGSTWAIGAMGHLGLEFTMVHIALVPLLIGMGVGYSIYILNRYYEGRGKGLRAEKAVRVSVNTIGVAILMCMTTTVIGFASFSISDIPPIQTLGILAGLGIFFSFILATTLLPSVVILRDRGKVGKVKAIVAKRGKNIDRALSFAATGAERHRRLVILVVAGVVVLCAISALGLSTTMSFKTFLPSNVPSITTQNEVENLFGGQSQIFVLARGDPLNPNSLMTMYQFENTVISDTNNRGQLITGSLSLADIVYERALAMEENVFHLTEPDIAILIENLRATPSTRTYMDMLLTKDNKESVILFYVNATNDKEMRQATNIVRGHVPEFTDELLNLNINGAPAVGGEPVITADILGSISSGMVKTTVVAIVVCFIVLSIIFESLLLGAMCILPVVLVVSWELGTLRLLGWPLDVLSMGISALVIGAGIDYSIQMTYRFREEWKSGRKPQEAIRTTAMTTGASILAAMATTAGVFAVLSLSRMPALGRFGGLTAIVIAYSFMAAFFVLPSIIMFYATRREKSRAPTVP
jgi:predicted RND superfamily exporter protein